MQGPLLEHPTERLLNPSLPQELPWPWANWILAVPCVNSGHPKCHLCPLNILAVKPSAHIQTPACMTRAALGMSSCPWGSAPRQTLTVCPGNPFDKRDTETGLLFLLPVGCGETWISNTPKYLTPEPVSNPD